MVCLKMRLNKYGEILQSIEKISCIEWQLNNYKKTNESLDVINEIADFVQENDFLMKYDSFGNLVNLLVDTIEYINKGNDLDGYIREVFVKLVELMREIKIILSNMCKINVLYRGPKDSLLFDFLTKEINVVNNIEDINFNSDEIKVLIYNKNSDDNIFNKFDITIEINELGAYLYTLCEKLYSNDYCYKYLKNSIVAAKEEKCEVIAVGNSYIMNGIQGDMLKPKVVNLSLSSQDLYYSYKLLEDIISNNKNIKTCIVGVAYYLLYHDLSMGTSEYSNMRVKNIYYPITKDLHNSKVKYELKKEKLQDYIDNEILKVIFDMEKVQGRLEYEVYQRLGTYFNKFVKRENISMLGKRKINDLTESERSLMASQRAEQHNILSKYVETKIENEEIILKIIELLNKSRIRCILLNLPVTEYYDRYINKTCKGDFYKFINSINEKCEFVDLYGSNILSEDDFVDFDHINEAGAIKISKYLNDNILNK